jgi:hypothetical protein
MPNFDRVPKLSLAPQFIKDLTIQKPFNLHTDKRQRQTMLPQGAAKQFKARIAPNFNKIR